MLQIETLSVHRGNIQALREVSLTVAEGEIVSLVGSNGAGKSTLLYTIAGVLTPTGGQIRYQGQELRHMRAERLARLGISLVPEGRQVFGALSVLDNLVLGTYALHAHRWRDLLGSVGGILRQEATRRRLAEVFALFPILEERGQQAAGSLSGGEQQMLAIGRSADVVPAPAPGG